MVGTTACGITDQFEPFERLKALFGGARVDVWGAILVLVRRFYLTAPIAAVTVLCAYLFTHSLKPEYQATSQMILVGPTAQTDPKAAVAPPVNPIAGFSTATLVETITIDATSVQSMQQLAASGNSTSFTIANPTRTAVLSITATGATPRQAVSTANAVATIIQHDLEVRQAPYTTDKSYQVTSQVLAKAQLASENTSSRTKAMAIALGIAVAVTILLTLLVDAVLMSYARRRSTPQRRASSVDDGAGTDQQRTTVVRS